MKPSEFAALVALLDDPDAEVYNTISNKLVDEGGQLVPLLENTWERTDDKLLKSRVEDVLHRIRFKNALDGLTRWVETGCADLLEGAVYVTQYQYPDVHYSVIDNFIGKVKQKVWLELNETLSALEKIKVLNHILYDSFGFRGNVDNFFSPNNNFINQLIETKKGGPVLMSLFYSLVAQRLGMPVFCVSLPRNFLVAYQNRCHAVASGKPDGKFILFYINPFNQGAVLGHKDIEQFLLQNNIDPKDEYFLPCDNRTAILQLLGSLLIAYKKVGQNEKIDDIKAFLQALVK
ncbi:MAG: transglutaminase-like domain-containing protein [Bacteroidales bacterium]|nr:transglutaminase-like domain-containing protein [Bacteroidales bacterium]MDD4673278.1 transglutaminase-like domain-containing protein [Bacteroidales bacterium]MDY0347841.1 transglutaminase-like domain-containing protein [Tenuifilaceae bacterium]